MGRKGIIGRLPVVYDPARRGFAVENSAEFVKTQIRQKLDDLAHGKPLRLTVTFEPERKGRSLNQNRMMWALLTIMADTYNGGRAGGMSPEDCYVQMLDEYGVDFDFWRCRRVPSRFCAQHTSWYTSWSCWMMTDAPSSV